MKLAMRHRGYVIVAAVMILLTLLTGIAVNRWCSAPGIARKNVTVFVPRGTSSLEMARLFVRSGVIEHPWLFVVASRIGDNRPLQAGEYEFPAESSIREIIAKMRRGDIVYHKITVPEGLTVFQVAAILRQAPALTIHPFALPEEGSLLPETYFYNYGEEIDALVEHMRHAMSQTMDSFWSGRSMDLPFANKKEAIILASVVERETAISDERPHIASVFINRLRKHMKLQSDPTVIYALSKGEGNIDHSLTHEELNFSSPFNSYLHEGLPPEPICNPGRASLYAVLHPLDSDDLYFVANGKGGHVFARTLDEHNHNVMKLRRIERERG